MWTRSILNIYILAFGIFTSNKTFFCRINLLIAFETVTQWMDGWMDIFNSWNQADD